MTGWFGRPATDHRLRLAGAPRLPRGYKMERIENPGGEPYWEVSCPAPHAGAAGWRWNHSTPGAALVDAWRHWASFQQYGTTP